mmetsp:Transcript_53787/g.107869  ORF Transcript_53787/g.107869 Transcript_53787/m.107869 type:complete len:309 (+) Transcript_53787:202-1128(+)
MRHSWECPSSCYQPPTSCGVHDFHACQIEGERRCPKEAPHRIFSVFDGAAADPQESEPGAFKPGRAEEDGRNVARTLCCTEEAVPGCRREGARRVELAVREESAAREAEEAAERVHAVQQPRAPRRQGRQPDSKVRRHCKDHRQTVEGDGRGREGKMGADGGQKQGGGQDKVKSAALPSGPFVGPRPRTIFSSWAQAGTNHFPRRRDGTLVGCESELDWGVVEKGLAESKFVYAVHICEVQRMQSRPGSSTNEALGNCRDRGGVLHALPPLSVCAFLVVADLEDVVNATLVFHHLFIHFTRLQPVEVA